MSTYEDSAPTLSKFITEEQFKADFPEPVADEVEQVDPEPGQKIALYDYIKASFATGRKRIEVVRVARDLGVPLWWVRLAAREIRAAYAAVWAPEVEQP